MCEQAQSEFAKRTMSKSARRTAMRKSLIAA
jgi:hypothetical protein